MPLSEQQQLELEKKVPRAIFLENVEQACRREGFDQLLSLLDQQYNKYRLVEGQLQRSHESMIGKIPEIEKTIQMIKALTANRKMNVDFMLNEGIFVRGKAKEGLEHISLWLGANTIVEMTFAEAEQLLAENLKNAKSSSEQIQDELAFIKDQKTTTQVNVARVYNLSIAMKREKQLAQTE